MIVLDRLPSLSRLPRWRVRCRCGDVLVLSAWRGEITPARKCRSCSLLGNHRGIFRSFRAPV